MLYFYLQMESVASNDEEQIYLGDNILNIVDLEAHPRPNIHVNQEEINAKQGIRVIKNTRNYNQDDLYEVLYEILNHFESKGTPNRRIPIFSYKTIKLQSVQSTEKRSSQRLLEDQNVEVKRQEVRSNDYGHMKFGKRGSGSNFVGKQNFVEFEDYGHMKFG